MEVLEGTAVLLNAVKFTRVPSDLPLELALGGVDVSRLLPQLQRILSRSGRLRVRTMLVIGSGRGSISKLENGKSK